MCHSRTDFQQQHSQVSAIINTLCREKTWLHIDLNSRMAMVRLLADLVEAMGASCKEVDAPPGTDPNSI
jgi:hypothetical protein